MKVTNQKTKPITEKSFLKNVITKAKTFIKDKVKAIKKDAKAFIRHLRKEYMGGKKKSNFLPGKMLQMQYKAKDATKKYDANPLIICLGPVKNKKLSKTHIIGLNMHWMPMADRIALASFFTELNKKRNGKIEYKDVKPFLNKFKGSPILRMYIINNISQKVIEMPTDMFMSAAAVPSEKWMGG